MEEVLPPSQISGKNTEYPNLRPWQKGQSGNPGGRPKKKPVTEAIEALADEKLPAKIKSTLQRSGFHGKTWAEAWAFGAGVKAARGDTPALKEITDRLEGKAEQSLKIFDGLNVGAAIRDAHRRARGKERACLTPE